MLRLVAIVAAEDGTAKDDYALASDDDAKALTSHDTAKC